jgi:hypothetical protein
VRTIWKFPVMPGAFTIGLPRGAEVLAAQAQDGEAMAWAVVDPAAPVEQRRFIAAGTGHPLPDGPLKHLGTFQLDGGALVFHLFEEGP